VKITTFVFHLPWGGKEIDCESVLSDAFKRGLIIAYDYGRNRDPWFVVVRIDNGVRTLRDTFYDAGYSPDRNWLMDETEGT